MALMLSLLQPGKEINFKSYSPKRVTLLGIEYDYDSIMHYPANAFSKNGYPTIKPLKANVKIGQRRYLSTSDVEEVCSCRTGGRIDTTYFR